ncbi:MAG: PpiC-type peptidyl-prolyl cis-trans isomerase [Deltaproteobacteria bacterium]|nr:PpiC-type peptidyl-prolyl cis-trans isomerase [Deltaproteobacteria bacterium]
MLENMRRQGASIFIYLIFGILVAIFVININPGQKGSGGGGCSTSSNLVVEVDGSKVTKTAYHVAYSNQLNQGRSSQRTHTALELLIRRELLAQAAAERGIRVTEELVDDEIKKGNFFLGGHRIPLDGSFRPELDLFDHHDDSTRTWNYAKFKQWVNGLDVSIAGYKDEQTRGIQASLMQELLVNSVQVSREEALADYLHKSTTVVYDVVTFSPAAYRSAMRLTDADIERYLASHEDDVKARYKSDERTYKDVKPQLKLRQIFIAKAEPAATLDDKKAGDDTKPADDKKPADLKAAEKPAPDDKKTDDKKTDDKKTDADKKAADKKAADKKAADKKAAGAAKKVPGLPIEEAKAKLEAARAAVATGKTKFADAAKDLSTDDAMKANGGDVGWRSADNAQLGEKAVSDAVKAMKPDETMTPVIVTDQGAYLIFVEGRREKDLSYDQVKHEIAAELARDTWSKEAAKRAALTALADATKDKKQLDQLFEREAEPAGTPSNQGITPEQMQQIQEQLRQQREQHGGDEGALEVETKDVPVAWKAEGDGGGGGSATTGSGSASGSAAPGSAATGSGSGSAAPGAGGASTPPAAEKPAVALLTPSNDTLRPGLFGDVPKPKVVKYGPVARAPQLPGVGKELTAVLFDQLSQNMIADRVYESEGSYVLVQLTGKGQPKMDDFDKQAPELISQMRAARAQFVVEDWLKVRCNALVKDGKIKPAADLLGQETDDKGNKMPSTYHPCMSFH